MKYLFEKIKKQFSAILEMPSSEKEKEELSALLKKNKELEKELARKEKSLAEVSALIALRKKDLRGKKEK